MLVAPNVPVDGLVAYLERAGIAQQPADLIGTEAPAEQILHEHPLSGCELAPPASPRAAAVSLFLRLAGAVRAVCPRAVAAQFSTDRARVPVHTAGDLSSG